jgi:tRNA(fMet)-specific endonuclease VapC
MSLQYLLDSDTCVFWLRKRDSVRQRVAKVGPTRIAVSMIALAELRYGAACSAHPVANHQAIDDFVGGITIVGVDGRVARLFGDIKADLRHQGMLIEDSDLLIAATARALGLTLVTNNTEHFQRVAGLSLENWA